MIRLMTLFVLVSGGLLGAPTAAAGTPDGFTPAVEAVCDIDKGTNRFGLCNAYCEAMDCDSGSNASAKACSKTLANYIKKSGGLEPPCEQQNQCPCVGRVDAVVGIDHEVDGVLERHPKLGAALIKVEPPIQKKVGYVMSSKMFYQQNRDLVECFWSTSADLRETEWFKTMRAKYQ